MNQEYHGNRFLKMIGLNRQLDTKGVPKYYQWISLNNL